MPGCMLEVRSKKMNYHNLFSKVEKQFAINKICCRFLLDYIMYVLKFQQDLIDTFD